MSESEEIFKKYVKDMIDFVQSKVRTQVKPTGDVYDILANNLAKQLPYGPGVDNAHAFLTNAVVSAAWCSWFAKARSRSDPQNFSSEYSKKYKEVIDAAYRIGEQYAEEYG
jgi:hypothetical protein